MKLNTPRWWYIRDSNHARVTRTVLKPLGWIWAGATASKIAKATPVDPGCAVISVGNLTVGGSGKTPVARETLRLLHAAGVDAHGLSRGYGGRLEGPVRVDPAVHTAADVGDEPLMLAQASPVWISRDRIAGARAAVADGAQAVALDDGHQNPALKKTVSLIVVDGETRGDEWPFGDGSVFPSGPMREPLKAAGCDLADFVPFPDHAAYSAENMRFLEDRAAVYSAGLVTTEKDWVRLPPKWRDRIVSWPVAAKFADEEAFVELLRSFLRPLREKVAAGG